MNSIKKIHRAWFVMLGLLLIQGGATGVFANTIGIVFSAIRTDMGFRAGDLSIYYMIRSLAAGLTVGLTSKLFFRGQGKHAKLVMVILGILMGGSYSIMGLFHHLWEWYIAAFVYGVGMSCITVIIPVVLRNWFRKQIGFVLGLVMSASGIFGAVFSPISSNLINTFGWRLAGVIISVIATSMIIIPALTLLVVSPEQVGLKPYGYEESHNANVQKEHTVIEKRPSIVFVYCMITILFSSCIVQFSNQLPTFGQVIGYSLSFGATMTSACMIGNLSGKLILGFLTDRIGFYNSSTLFLGITIVSMVLLLVGQSSELMLCAASLMYGFAYSIAATGPGLLFPDIYGPDEYREKLSRFQSISLFFYAGLSVIFPYIYDFTGSYNPVFVFGIVVMAIAIYTLNWLRRYSLSAAKKHK